MYISGPDYFGTSQPSLFREASRKGGENSRNCSLHLANLLWLGGGNQLCGRKYPSQTETRPHYQTFQSNCLTLGVWNVRTLCSLNSLTNKNLPTWKAYCACLQRTCPFSTDVAALSKTSFPGECDVKKADYKFFWKGKDANELCIYGISLAIKTELVKKLILTPTSTSWCPSEFRFASRSTYFSLCFNSRLRWRN